jgi:exosortase/archaeosortase family protein
VLTDTAHRPTDAARFILRAVAVSLGIFGLLRLPWTEAQLVLPLTRLQGALASHLFGTPTLSVEITLACSGADAMALCLAAVLAYPVTWRTRLAGAGGGAALILGLNTLRIGTLGRASPTWFNALHVYVWPAVLTLAIAGYVFAWMRLADRRPPLDERTITPQGPPAASAPCDTASLADAPRRRDGGSDVRVTERLAPQPSRQFVGLTGAFLLVFLAASPIYLESAAVLTLAGFIAGAAAATLSALGVSAHAAANVLWTARGGFLVTQECISTPLIPVYLAAVCTYSPTWRRLILGVLATLPLFIGLGIARLLVVALPEVVASPLFLVHAFYQLLLGAVVVFVAAVWRHGGRAAPGHALIGIVAGVLIVHLLGPFSTRLVAYQAGTPLDDPQGAIALLPAFQVGLYLALWVAAFGASVANWGRFLIGLAVLGLTQTAGLLALQALASHAGLTAQVRDVRGWAVAGPVLIFAAVVNVARARR